MDFEYTANGELLSKTDQNGTTTYAYDVLGNLLRVDLPDGRVIEYVVDGQNRRVGKKLSTAPGQPPVLVQGWLYDGQLRIVAELDGTGRRQPVRLRGVPELARVMVRGGVTYRILKDHLGSPRLVVDASTGAVVHRMDFDEFGNVLTDDNPGFQPFGFAGGLYDRDTRLVRFGARDYDPAVARWTAKDSIGFEGDGSNLYDYVLADPVSRIDPEGTESLFQQVTGMTFRQSIIHVFRNTPLRLLNRGQWIRFGLGRRGGVQVLRLSGRLVARILRNGHIDLIDLGPL